MQQSGSAAANPGASAMHHPCALVRFSVLPVSFASSAWPPSQAWLCSYEM
jgi:hypothetical protein